MVYNFQERDYGTYKCVAKNPRGETDGAIRLYSKYPATFYSIRETPENSQQPVLPTAKNYDGCSSLIAKFLYVCDPRISKDTPSRLIKELRRRYQTRTRRV